MWSKGEADKSKQQPYAYYSSFMSAFFEKISTTTETLENRGNYIDVSIGLTIEKSVIEF